MAVIYKELDNNMVMAYSDAGYKIHGGNPEADYVTATDPKGLNRIYTETDIKVELQDEKVVKILQKYNITIE